MHNLYVTEVINSFWPKFKLNLPQFNFILGL